MSWLLWHMHRYQWHSQLWAFVKGGTSRLGSNAQPSAHQMIHTSAVQHLRTLALSINPSLKLMLHNNLTNKQEMSISMGFFVELCINIGSCTHMSRTWSSCLTVLGKKLLIISWNLLDSYWSYYIYKYNPTRNAMSFNIEILYGTCRLKESSETRNMLSHQRNVFLVIFSFFTDDVRGQLEINT